MRKKEIIKRIKEYFIVKKKYFEPYDLEVSSNNKTYHIKILNINMKHQITVNSKTVWNLKKGKISGIKFKTIDSVLLDLTEFNKLDNKIIMLTSKPYRVLKALNESDLLDISDNLEIDNILVTYDILELLKYID